MDKKVTAAVAAVIFNEAGEVLLQKRRDVNQWCIISGHVEFGETIEEAILREIFEETNTNASLVRFIGVYSTPLYQIYHYSTGTVQYVTSYFEARLKEEIISGFSNNESQELRFFRVSEIPENLALISPNWLNDALDNSGSVFLR
jgi:8-oxo-dGTP diphosphatase